MRPEDLAVVSLAAYRLTRLVTSDKLTAPQRQAVQRWALTRRMAERHSLKLDDLVGCNYCAGWWVTVLVLVAWRTRAGRPVVRAFAAAGAASLLSAVDVYLAEVT